MNAPQLQPARVLILGTDRFRDQRLVGATLDLAAAWLGRGRHASPRRQLVLIIPPAPAEASAEQAAYLWADRAKVPTELPPDGWEELDDPDLDHAANLITAADPDLVLSFDRFGSPTITPYTTAAAVVCHVPTWHINDHRGDPAR